MIYFLSVVGFMHFIYIKYIPKRNLFIYFTLFYYDIGGVAELKFSLEKRRKDKFYVGKNSLKKSITEL